jgi:hypothetical protein
MTDGKNTFFIGKNIKSLTADKEWSSNLGVGQGTNNSSPQKLNHIANYSQKPRIRGQGLYHI